MISDKWALSEQNLNIRNKKLKKLQKNIDFTIDFSNNM